jgi:hypothetical protein
MRLIALILFVGAISGGASAQTHDCRAIPNPGASLACYDKASPPTAAAASPKTAPGPSRSKIDSEKYLESLGSEDVQLMARMNGICRGC